MRFGAGEIRTGERPEPDSLLAGQNLFHNPTCRQAVDPYAVVIDRCKKRLTTREHLAGEPEGIDLIFHGCIVHGTKKEHIPERVKLSYGTIQPVSS